MLLPLCVVAQTEQRAKILLTNGIKIKGGIVRSFDENMMEVAIDPTETLLIRYEHIRRISFKKYGNISSDFERNLNTVPTPKTNSFFHEIRAGLLFGEENVSGSINTINGYQFNQYLGTGLGVGVNKFGNYLTVPIYASVKGYLFDRKVTPFYFGDIGYGLAWASGNTDDIFEIDNVKGGLYWQLGLGYQFNFYNHSMVFTLGYVNQDSSAEYTYFRPWDIDNVEIKEDRILRRFLFSIGFLF